MAAPFVPNQNIDTAIAAEASGHIFAAGTEPWLGQAGPMDWLQFFSLSPGQANIWITGKEFYDIISFIEIRPDEVQGIEKDLGCNNSRS